MYINYEYYRIFYYVARYENFTQAANVLRANQPNITRAIKNLENELGCILFNRSNRGATLTPEGKRLYGYISKAVELIQAGEHELSYAGGFQSGDITISVSETAMHEMLLEVLNEFRLKYPGIKIRLYSQSTPQAINAIRTGTAELAVVTTPTDIASPLSETRLQMFDEILVCGKRFSDLQSKRLSLNDLQKLPLISLGANTKTYEFYHNVFLKYDLILSPDMEATTTDQILPMVKNNLGLGFLPRSFAMPAIESGEVFELELIEEIPKRHICILKNTDHPLSMAAKEFEKMLMNKKK